MRPTSPLVQQLEGGLARPVALARVVRSRLPGAEHSLRRIQSPMQRLERGLPNPPAPARRSRDRPALASPRARVPSERRCSHGGPPPGFRARGRRETALDGPDDRKELPARPGATRFTSRGRSARGGREEAASGCSPGAGTGHRPASSSQKTPRGVLDQRPADQQRGLVEGLDLPRTLPWVDRCQNDAIGLGRLSLSPARAHVARRSPRSAGSGNSPSVIRTQRRPPSVPRSSSQTRR